MPCFFYNQLTQNLYLNVKILLNKKWPKCPTCILQKVAEVSKKWPKWQVAKMVLYLNDYKASAFLLVNSALYGVAVPLARSDGADRKKFLTHVDLIPKRLQL